MRSLMYQCIDRGADHGKRRWKAVYRIQDGTEREFHETREAAVEALISAAKIMNGSTIRQSDIVFGKVKQNEVLYETDNEAGRRELIESATSAAADVAIWPKWKRKNTNSCRIADRDILVAVRREVSALNSRLKERYEEVPFAQLACVIEDLTVISNKILFAYLPSLDRGEELEEELPPDPV